MQRIRQFLWIALFAFAPATAPAQEPENPLAAKAVSLVARIDDLRREGAELQKSEARATGEELTVAVLQLRQVRIEIMRELSSLVENVLEQEGLGLDASETRARTEEYCALVDKRARALINRLEEQIALLRSRRAEAEGEAREEIDEQLAVANAAMDEGFRLYVTHVSNLDALGLPSKQTRADLARQIRQHAESLAGRLELARTRLEQADSRAAEAPDDTALRQAEAAAQTRVDGIASRLTRATDIMEGLDLDTARHRQTVIQTTGQITGDVLDAEVAHGLFVDAKAAVASWWKETGPALVVRVIVFFGVMFGFWLLAAVTRKLVGRTISRPGLQLTTLARAVIARLVGRTIMIFGVFVALSQIGVEVGALLAGLGIAGFIVGFALQDSLGNFAAGALILIYRPYDVGDVIESAGVRGRVSDMTLVSTTILTFDNETLVVPNKKIWGDVIKNVTNQNTRRVDMVFRTSYDDDIPRTEAIFASVLEQHPMVLGEPEPLIKVHKLDDSWVEFAVRPWVATADYWTVYWDLNREVKLRFDREGIRIPIPQQEIHLSDARRAVEGRDR